MPIPLMRLRSFVLLASAAAAGLLLVLPFTGLAQTLTPDTQKFRPDKQALIEREAGQISVAKAAPRPAKDVSKLPRIQRLQIPRADRPTELATTSPLPHRSAATGTIVDSGLAPFPGSLYTFENRWFERTPAGDLVVYAGAVRDDPAQGVLAVRLIGATLGPATVYRTPARAGTVRIVGATGTRLSLVAGNGSQLTFDVSSRTFSP